MVRIRRIKTTDPLYPQEVDLRTRVLLAPVGLDIEGYQALSPGREEACEHFVGVFDHPQGERVLAAATLYAPPPGSDEPFGKVAQVCVDPQRQNEGIGQKLMVAIEARAFGELGLPGLYCHAQLIAIPFYEKIGWKISSDTFLEAGIKHKRMEIVAPDPSLSTADPELEFEVE